ncbi:MAG: hypothetical protein H8E84_06285 [Flavobacteriales bacterium]|nr:hypothetical protein [Flavobacteriales bacterium]
MKKLFTLLFICVFGIANAQTVIVNSIVPNSGENCETLSVTISGSYLGQFSGTSFVPDLSFTQTTSSTTFYGAVTSHSSNTILADVTIPSNVPTGLYDVVVHNSNVIYPPYSSTGVLSNGFEVTAPTTAATMILGNTQPALSSMETYSVSQVLGSTFTWFNAAGAIVSGQGTNSIDIQWGNTAGVFDVCVVELVGSQLCPLDTLCLSINVGSGSNIEDYNLTNKKLVKIIDALGRKVSLTSNRKTTLFYIYDDGTVKKKQFIE